MKSKIFTIILFICSVCGCSSIDIEDQYPDSNVSLSEKYFQVDIPTHDGLSLKATVYQPQLAPGETAPVIISTHGFGAFRMPRPLSVYGTMIITGEASLAAWHNQYWVISYDQRGFGNSEGKVHLMSPDHEVKDVSSVIDWAEQYLPRTSKDSTGGTAIGMIGESYGGGAQLLASIYDDRIDAIVPIATWYDLASSIAPNNHVKTLWGTLLLGFGGINSGFDFGKVFENLYSDIAKGKLSAESRENLKVRAPRFYCENKKYPKADILLIQGFRDSIFTINEGIKNRECGLQGGNDVRLIAIQDGHILPWPVQSLSGMPLFNTQQTIVCDDKPFTTINMIVQWWDLKLKKISEPEPIPDICITFSDNQGMAVSQIPIGGEKVSFQQATISLTQTGSIEVFMKPLDKIISYFIPVNHTQPVTPKNMSGGFIRPGFVPLKVADKNSYIAGIPIANLVMKTTTKNKNGVVLVAIGIRKKDSRYIQVLSEQYTPLVGDGDHRLNLAAISSQLEKGDTIGLVLQGSSGQYWLNPRGWFSHAVVSGHLELPLFSNNKANNSL